MRAIRIDPVSKTITEIEIENTYESLKAAMGGVWLEAVRVDQYNVMWVNEEGFLRDKAVIEAELFRVPWHRQVMTGLAIITGIDEAGENCDHGLPMDHMPSWVRFVEGKFKGVITTEGVTNHPVLGPTHTIKTAIDIETEEKN